MRGKEDCSNSSRREALSLLLSATASAYAQGTAPAPAKPVSRDQPNLALVSRHLQWTDAETGIAVAKEAGFPAILWTVRRGAHIEPAEVEKELPRIVKLTRAAGLETPMIITAIGDEASDKSEAILATMRGLASINI